MNNNDQNGTRTWFEGLIRTIFKPEPHTREELLKLLRNSAKRGIIEADAQSMMEGVLRVFETEVRDVMIPRAQMVILEKDEPLEKLLQVVVRSAHSRFPVIEPTKDEVVGILLAKDLLAAYLSETPFDIQELLREPILVPEGKRLCVLLKDFRTTRSHMAIVIDEYGSLSGLITIEDVLEEIVGDIEDEYEPNRIDKPFIKRESANLYLILALTPIEDFNEYFKASLSDKECDTVGGFVTHAFEHLPQKGEHIVLDKFKFTVVSADKRRIKLLKMEII